MDPTRATIRESAAATPDLDRDIHYALRAEPPLWHTRADKPETLCCPILGQFRMLVVPLSIVLALVLLQFLPGPKAVTVSLTVVVGVVLFLVLVRRGRSEKRENERLAAQFAPVSDRQYRLRVTGPAARLEQHRKLMAGELEVFEPRVFRVGRAGRHRVSSGLALSAIFAVVLLALLVAEKVARLEARHLGAVTVFMALVLTYPIWAFLWPAYVRLVPGRLDVLSYSILGYGKPTIRSIDLRSARILVTIPGSAMILTAVGDRPAVLDVGLLSGADPLAFERALLAAARSDAPTPQLANDVLGG